LADSFIDSHGFLNPIEYNLNIEGTAKGWSDLYENPGEVGEVVWCELNL
jgi:hypothetical protein